MIDLTKLKQLAGKKLNARRLHLANQHYKRFHDHNSKFQDILKVHRFYCRAYIRAKRVLASPVDNRTGEPLAGATIRSTENQLARRLEDMHTIGAVLRILIDEGFGPAGPAYRKGNVISMKRWQMVKAYQSKAQFKKG
jgi:hypothetical protein